MKRNKRKKKKKRNKKCRTDPHIKLLYHQIRVIKMFREEFHEGRHDKSSIDFTSLMNWPDSSWSENCIPYFKKVEI